MNEIKKPTRLYSQNLLHHLFDREAGFNRWNRRGNISSWHLRYEREFHKSITPCLTVQNVDKPIGYMRKFTPDGKMLLSFSEDQKSLQIFHYKGIGRVQNMLKNHRSECITAADNSIDSLKIRQRIFCCIFPKRWDLPLTTETPYCLSREFSVFLEGGRYVLLASLAAVIGPNWTHPLRYPDLVENYNLNTYTFFLIDLKYGYISDLKFFRSDIILLAHNHGVTVSGRTVAILSHYRQCIDILELINGKLILLFSIGEVCADLNGGHIEFAPRLSAESTMSSSLPLSQLKQTILSYMYRRILQIQNERIRKFKIKRFYRNFNAYEKMTISKIQLIDNEHLLIRYEEFENDQHHYKVFIFYSIPEAKIIKFFRNDSMELLYLLRNYCDTFRNVRSAQTNLPSSSPSNNIYFRAAFNSAIGSMPIQEAALRFNPTLPISTQSFSTTLYLDCNLFDYDDRLISAVERPKFTNMQPIRFIDRNTGITKFRIQLEKSGTRLIPATNTRELVAFIFHPYEPFIISIQKFQTRYVVNFHLYNSSTIVQK